MAKFEHTCVYVCSDCQMPIAYGDFTGLDFHYSPERAEERMEDIEIGMNNLAKKIGFLSTGDDCIDFSAAPCACCGTREAGARHEVIGTKTITQAA